MQRILILGGGGFGHELYGYIKSDITAGRLPSHVQLGVLDDNPECELISKLPDAIYFGSLTNYKSKGDEVVLIAIGNAQVRFKAFNQVQEKGLSLFTFVHPSALIMPDATLGQGVIVCPNTIVNAGAHVGDNVAVNVFCSIGHGACIGAHSVLSPYSAMSGDSSLGERSFMGTRATLFPGVSMGWGAVVDTHSAVKKSVGNNMIVSVRGEYLVFENRMNRLSKPSIE